MRRLDMSTCLARLYSNCPDKFKPITTNFAMEDFRDIGWRCNGILVVVIKFPSFMALNIIWCKLIVVYGKPIIIIFRDLFKIHILFLASAIEWRDYVVLIPCGTVSPMIPHGLYKALVAEVRSFWCSISLGEIPRWGADCSQPMWVW